MTKIANLLVIAANDDDFPVKEFENGTFTYIIREADRDDQNQTLALLLESSDKNAPNTRYVDHAAKTKRDFNKEKNEGGGHSAHVLISLRHESSADNVYLGVIESAPNFPVHRVKSILNHAIRLLCKEEVHFTYRKPGGSKRDIPYVPHLEFFGHASNSLQTDLEAGKIHSLTLMEPDAVKPLGQGKFFSGTEKSMKVKMVREPAKGKVLSSIRSAVKSVSKDYSRVRISFQPEAGGRSTHIDLDTDTGNIIGESYVKSKHFGGITPSIDTTAVDNLAPQLVSRMKAVLIKERS